MSKSESPVFFYITSYAWEVEYKPKCVVELARMLLNHKGETLVKREPYHVDAIQNALEKLGYMFLAKAEIEKIDLRRQEFRAYGVRFHVYITYHAWNFLIACKATLDAISGLLNKEYKLGYAKGHIDLKHDFFFGKLKRKNEELWRRIGEYREWIKEISMLRDHFIHRRGLIAVPSGSGRDATTRARVYSLGKLILAKPGGSIVDWEEFCQISMANITKLFEIVCNDLVKRRKMVS